MNKLLQRGLEAYKIFLNNKLAMALMMFIPGLMMLAAALNGKGNDVKTMPFWILVAGLVFSFWGFYKIGFIKSNLNKITDREEKQIERKAFVFQIIETIAYLAVVSLGVFLLLDESFTDNALDIMAGGFTVLNGVIGSITVFRGRNNKDFQWKLTLVLSVVELIFGTYFIIKADELGINNYILMGSLTSVAGLIEVIKSLSLKALKGAVKDGKDMLNIMRNKETSPKSEEEKDGE